MKQKSPDGKSSYNTLAFVDESNHRNVKLNKLGYRLDQYFLRTYIIKMLELTWSE